MAFPNPFKREPAAGAAPSQEPRVEPSLGGGAPEAAAADDSPWMNPAGQGAQSVPEVPSINETREPNFAAKEAAEPAAPGGTTGVKAGGEHAAQEDTDKADKADKANKPEKSAARRLWPFGRKAQDGEGAETASARIPSDQELLARQKTRNRMVGAAALLMAAVVVAPLFLDSEKALEEPKVSTTVPPVTEAQRVEVPIEAPTVPTKREVAQAEESANPATDTGAVARVDTAVTPQSAAQAARTEAANVEAAMTAQKAKAEKAAEEARAAAAAKAKAEKAAQEAKAKAESAAPAAPTGKGFFVQVGAFGSEAKANEVVKRIRASDLPAYTMKVKGRNLWRVRVGVFKSREQAVSAIGRLALMGYHQKLSPEQQ